jgi:hypothetical protein
MKLQLVCLTKLFFRLRRKLVSALGFSAWRLVSACAWFQQVSASGFSFQFENSYSPAGGKTS